MRTLFVLPCIAMTFLCWGNYGPLMHHGVEAMENSRWRPFVCVGLAYFLIAVVVPLLVLRSRGESGRWTVAGTWWSLIAGSVGAIGALGIIMALNFGGKPIYVMPLVFGCAPVVNTFVTMLMNRSLREASSIFLAGVMIVALGAAGVLYFKPAPPKKDAGEAAAAAEDAQPSEKKNVAERVGTSVLAMLSIALTALCWGCYGPVLHKGQMKMKGSRLRPLLCVGLAYFGIAVVVPMAVLMMYNEPGAWFPGGSPAGFLWSMAAGAAGAIGALGIIMAFNFGGKPILVMPLVFGGAPVVNTFTTMLSQGTIDNIPMPFWGSLGMVILGAVMVLIFAPKPGHKKPAKQSPPAAEPEVTDHPLDDDDQTPPADDDAASPEPTADDPDERPAGAES